jgi:cytochrome c553
MLILTFGLLVACGQSAPAPAAEPAAEEPAAEAPAEEPTEAPAEEPAEEATEAPAEEEVTASEEMTETAAMTETTAMTETESAEATPEATEEPAEEGAAAPADDAVALGGYLVTISGGCGCHMNRDLGGLAGGNEFETPNGLVYASNITPDEETGIGTWTAEDIAMALHTGAEPDGGQLHPVMPYARFSVLSDAEALAVGAYLLSLDPVSNVITDTELADVPVIPVAEAPAEAPTDPVARGQQLVEFTGCGGCHTPKNDDGTDMEGMLLAGAPLRDEFAANITPDEATGIGSWSEEAIATFLQTGAYPDGSQVEGAMAQQIDRRFSTLTDDDAAAIAAYLKSIPAVENAPAQ